MKTPLIISLLLAALNLQAIVVNRVSQFSYIDTGDCLFCLGGPVITETTPQFFLSVNSCSCLNEVLTKKELINWNEKAIFIRKTPSL